MNRRFRLELAPLFTTLFALAALNSACGSSVEGARSDDAHAAAPAPDVARGSSNAPCSSDSQCPRGERCVVTVGGEFVAGVCGRAEDAGSPAVEVATGTSDAGVVDANVPAVATCATPTFAPYAFPDCDDDGIPNAADNCPGVANATQVDGNADGVGDACELATANCKAVLAAFKAGGSSTSYDFSGQDLRGCVFGPNAYLNTTGTLDFRGANLECAQTASTDARRSHPSIGMQWQVGWNAEKLDMSGAKARRFIGAGNWSVARFVADGADVREAWLFNNLNRAGTYSFVGADARGTTMGANCNAPISFVFDGIDLSGGSFSCNQNMGASSLRMHGAKAVKAMLGSSGASLDMAGADVTGALVGGFRGTIVNTIAREAVITSFGHAAVSSRIATSDVTRACFMGPMHDVTFEELAVDGLLCSAGASFDEGSCTARLTGATTTCAKLASVSACN